MKICDLLFELCEDERVYDPDFDLIENNVFDSLLYITLFARLEDSGIVIHPTKIDRTLLRTPRGIETLIENRT